MGISVDLDHWPKTVIVKTTDSEITDENLNKAFETLYNLTMVSLENEHTFYFVWVCESLPSATDLLRIIPKILAYTKEMDETVIWSYIILDPRSDFLKTSIETLFTMYKPKRFELCNKIPEKILVNKK